MIILKGKGVFGGVAIGKVSFYRKAECTIKRYHVEDTEAEILRFSQAAEQAVLELKALYEKAVPEMGEANAQIFEVHQMMLEDQDYQDSVRNIIQTQKVNAEYAVGMTGDNFARMFEAMDDAYFKERAADVKDISERLVRILLAGDSGKIIGAEPFILAADDLAPSETMQLDKTKVLAFVTGKGSVNSHTAIIARTLNIPAVVDVGEMLTQSYDQKMAAVDGFTGTIYIDPDEEILERMRRKQKEDMEEKMLLQELKGEENITLDGRKIEVYANIGSIADLAAALRSDAGGIGLFRSEFLYLERSDYPTEEEQFQAYKTAAENMAGRKVIIRTMDIGADKKADYFELPQEENPALGFRAIRICLSYPDLFRTQLRAILRASAYGKLAVMFPMIISVEEVQEVKRIWNSLKEELKQAQIPFDETMEIGIMIETPSAVMISDQLAKEVDFFSVGTNDLTQYTLALDRQNPRLERFYDAHHPALLRMLEMVVRNAHEQGIWAGICGELGADLSLTGTFLKMGIDELSVAPSMILPLRRRIREIDVSKL